MVLYININDEGIFLNANAVPLWMVFTLICDDCNE